MIPWWPRTPTARFASSMAESPPLKRLLRGSNNESLDVLQLHHALAAAWWAAYRAGAVLRGRGRDGNCGTATGGPDDQQRPDQQCARCQRWRHQRLLRYQTV